MTKVYHCNNKSISLLFIIIIVILYKNMLEKIKFYKIKFRKTKFYLLLFFGNNSDEIKLTVYILISSNYRRKIT